LDRRILSFISVPGQSLSETVISPLQFASILLVTTGSKQVGLEQFTESSSVSQNRGPIEETPRTNTEDEYTEDEEEDCSKGLIYARVSSQKQQKTNDSEENDIDDVKKKVHDEGSIEGQIDELEEIADREDIHLPYDPVVDGAESGTDFDRDGIQEVFEKAKRKDLDYLLIEKVDRIGRSAAETLYFIYILQSECGVTLITPRGHQDVSEQHGLMHTTLKSLMAEIQNDLRIAKANKEKIRGFLEKKNWDCKTRITPLGYERTDYGWLEVDPEEKPIARDMFKKFAECENYAATERYLENKYGEEYLDGKKVRTMIRYSVYIGKPQLPESWLEGTIYENNLYKPNLHLLRAEDHAEIDVSEDVFHEVQEIIEKKDHQDSDEDVMDLLDFIEEFSLFAVIQGSDPAKLVHHCGEPLSRMVS